MSVNEQSFVGSVQPAVGQTTYFAEKGVGWITLDNLTKYNAISIGMWNSLVEALDLFERDGAVRCVVISGAGDKAFCAGADLGEKDRMEVEPGQDEQEVLAVAALERIRQFPKPVIAMISGYCLGAGMALASHCDLRVTSTNARFGIPAAKLGLPYYYAGMKRICDLVGPSNAKRLIFTADRLTADEALRIGLVDLAYAPAELKAEVKGMATRIAGNAPLVLATVKYTIETIFSDAADKDRAGCLQRAQACRESEDHLEGMRAFMEKRPPVFNGR